MPVLSVEQLATLNTGAFSNNGAQAPNSVNLSADQRNLACWNFALYGLDTAAYNRTYTPDNLYTSILQYEHGMLREPMAMNQEFADELVRHYGAARAFVDTISVQIEHGQDGDDYRREISTSLMSIAAIVAGLTVTSDGNPAYRIHMVTPGDTWYNWEHWGISVPNGGGRNYIQKVPGNDAAARQNPDKEGADGRIYCRCSRMWDSQLAGYRVTTIGVNGLLQTHVNALFGA
jgi:hypothetical protein